MDKLKIDKKQAMVMLGGLRVPVSVETAMRARAKRLGCSLADYMRALIARDLAS
jgi:hypothetical protein